MELVHRAAEHRGTGAPGRRTPWNGCAGQANTVERVRRAGEHRGTGAPGTRTPWNGVWRTTINQLLTKSKNPTGWEPVWGTNTTINICNSSLYVLPPCCWWARRLSRREFCCDRQMRSSVTIQDHFARASDLKNISSCCWKDSGGPRIRFIFLGGGSLDIRFRVPLDTKSFVRAVKWTLPGPREGSSI